jgi:hypothetical protein
MRVPYVVGRWVRGDQHYGRRRLIHYLLNVSDSALWLVGTRRMGKTSLLRQLEYEADRPGSQLVPLFWDLQGCDTPWALSDELQYAIEDAFTRFAPFGVTATDLAAGDAVAVLRRIARRLSAHDRTLFLLIDEGEALIKIGRTEPNWLARLRKVFQDDRQRTVLTSTKLLTKLNELTVDWPTSPFLFGFSMANLWSLDEIAAEELICQTQSEMAVPVDEQLRTEILAATNRHPYLIQYLCQRLFVNNESGVGGLRPIEPTDLVPDHLLAGFFQVDFQHLSRLERRVLLAIVHASMASQDELHVTLSDLDNSRLKVFLYGLNKLGYIRQIGAYWTVGNEFLRQWLTTNYEVLATQQDSPVSSSRVEELVTRGASIEVLALQKEIRQLRADLTLLERKQHLAIGVEREQLAQKIDFLRRTLQVAQQELTALSLFQAS